MTLAKMTRLAKHFFISSILILLSIHLVSTRANAQADDLFNAAKNGDAAAVQALLDKGADVNAKKTNGATALMAASQLGHTEVLELLLAKGADINAKAQSGATALLIACQNGRTEVVKALVAKGADTNAKASNGATALILASQQGNKEIVQALLTKGADVNAKMDNGATALMHAANNGDIDVVKVLLAAGADVSATASNGATALNIATEAGHKEVIELLSKASPTPSSNASSETYVAMPNDIDCSIQGASFYAVSDQSGKVHSEGSVRSVTCQLSTGRPKVIPLVSSSFKDNRLLTSSFGYFYVDIPDYTTPRAVFKLRQDMVDDLRGFLKD
jgi:ankyrin repeat protein